MKKRCALLLGLLITSHAQATLYDRGGGLIYDDVLNVTWLQDANFGTGSQYDDGAGPEDGLMTLISANAWATNLSYYDSVRNTTWTDWRLPVAVDTGSPGCNSSSGGTDCGINVQTVNDGTVYSELAYMYYVNLGNTAYGGIPNPGPFINFKAGDYWLIVENRPGESSSWSFNMSYGSQETGWGGNNMRAWALRDGDVAAIPEADTWAMLLVGLSLVGLAVRRRPLRGPDL